MDVKVRRMGRSFGWFATAAWVLTLLAASATASADLLSVTPDAMSGWQGSNVSSHTYDGVQLNITLEYAAFAPGDYPGTDPSGGSEFVYAFQVFNGAASTVGVTALSVGLSQGSMAADAGEDLSGAVGAWPGISPDLSVVGTSSVHWGFGWIAGAEVMPGENSTVLLFTSPNAPTWQSSTTTDGGLPVPSGPLPSPIPEPASAVILLAGAALAILRRRR